MKQHVYVVIFRSTRTADATELYDEWSTRLENAVVASEGYVSHSSFRDEKTRQGITIAYFESEDAIRRWREHADHTTAQQLGREHFYENYSVVVARIERQYEWQHDA